MVMKVLLLTLTLGLVVTLAGCDVEHYDQSIDAEGGFAWMQWIVTKLAELTYNISKFAGGYYIVGLFTVTLIIRIIGWPIYSKSTAMSANMQIAQPELERLKEKYQDKKDEASQRQMQQEMMQIYKKYNINPLGCLFPFLQMPIFIAMYQVVRRLPKTDRFQDIDFKFAFLDFQAGNPMDAGVTFSFADHWINIIMAAIVGTTMYFYQRYAMKKPEYLQNKKYQSKQAEQSQKTMKYMTYFMVIMLTSIAFTNLGIAFYWIIGNLFQFLQTYVNRKKTYRRHFEQNLT
jgi:YidC/Oxa1 family membrane protein insertase